MFLFTVPGKSFLISSIHFFCSTLNVFVSGSGRHRPHTQLFWVTISQMIWIKKLKVLLLHVENKQAEPNHWNLELYDVNYVNMGHMLECYICTLCVCACVCVGISSLSEGSGLWVSVQAAEGPAAKVCPVPHQWAASAGKIIFMNQAIDENSIRT